MKRLTPLVGYWLTGLAVYIAAFWLGFALITVKCGPPGPPPRIPLSQHVELATLVDHSDLVRGPTIPIRKIDIRSEHTNGQCILFFHGETRNFAILRDRGYDGSGCSQYELFAEAWISYVFYADDPGLYVTGVEWVK